MKLTKDTLLERSANIRLRIGPSGAVTLDVGGGAAELSAHALWVLHAARTPVLMGELTERFSAPSAAEWMAFTQVIFDLVSAGALREAGTAPKRTLGHGFGGLPIHIEMLNDRQRTERFLRGIANTVKAGDVVVDVGAGTGVLSIAAARAGAKRVYALEASSMAVNTRALVRANGCGEVIEVIEAWSTSVTLPEKADVLVTEMIGNEPLAEGALEVALDARRRHLRPGARMVPCRLRILAQAVRVPQETYDGARFSATHVERYRDWYQFDCGLLADLNPVVVPLHVRAREFSSYQLVGDPSVVADIDLENILAPVAQGTATLALPQGSRVNAVALVFEADLGGGEILSLRRDVQPGVDATHWRYPVWVFDELEIKAKEALSVAYAYDGRASVKVDLVRGG